MAAQNVFSDSSEEVLYRAGMLNILKINLYLRSQGFHIALIRGQMTACDDMVISVI